MVSPRLPEIRLGRIGFVNTLPLYCALAEAMPPELRYTLVTETPRRLNRAVQAGELDISPVSSAFYLRHRHTLVRLADLSVSSPGAVESVLFVSHQPMEHLIASGQPIPVPDDSETAVALLRYLFVCQTGVDPAPQFTVYAAADVEPALAAHGCALVIGDRALLHATRTTTEHAPQRPALCYDLARLWFDQTQLPFVFAVWVAPQSFAREHPEALKQVNDALCHSRDAFFSDAALLAKAVLQASQQSGIPAERIRHYWCEALRYDLGAAQAQSLTAFSDVLGTLDAAASASPPLAYAPLV